MTNELVQLINQVIPQLPIPPETAITPEAVQQFEQATDLLSTYSGEPKVLVESLRAYLETKSRPLAYTGIARVIAAASYERNDVFDQQGIAQALNWLEQAQEIAPNRAEIKLTKVMLLLYLRRTQEARALLDALAQAGAPSFGLCLLEITYWDAQRDIARVEQWYQRGLPLVQSEDQRVRLLDMSAKAYLKNNLHAQALALFDQLLVLRPDNPWYWHNGSVVLYRQKNYDQAEKYNRRALRLMDFSAAHKMQELIQAGQKREAAERGFVAKTLWSIKSRLRGR